MDAESDSSLRVAYKRHFRKSVLLTAGMLILIFIVSIVSISISQYPMGFTETYHILMDHIRGVQPITYVERLKDMIVWDMNLPRAIGGVAVGATLGVGGAIMQSIIRNPLADPYTTGISSGALFGVTLYVILGFSVFPFVGGDTGLIINAFIFALIPAAVILRIQIHLQIYTYGVSGLSERSHGITYLCCWVQWPSY